jgi:hypothetical protein
MEQPPRRPEGGDNRVPPGDGTVPLELEPARREEILEEGIEAAVAADTEVEDWIARHIALQLREGEDSALGVFARTGEITSGLRYELLRNYDQQPARRRRWVDHLGTYAVHREDPEPVEGWAERAAVRDRFDAAWRAVRPRAVRTIESRRCDIEAARARDERRLITNDLAIRMLVMLAPSPHSAIARFVAEGRVTEAFSTELSERHEQGGARKREWMSQLGAWILAKTASPIPGWWPAPEAPSRPKSGDVSGNPADDAQPGENQPSAEAADKPGRPDRLADLEERLAPLPDLGDIPPPGPGTTAGSGYEWMEQLPPGWHAEPSWGRDGWDLGAWPLVVAALFVDEERGRYAVATYTEGDVTINRYRSRGALHAAVNEIAEFHWRLGQSLGPSDLPDGRGLLAKHCGPYSEARCERERAERGEQPDTDQAT